MLDTTRQLRAFLLLLGFTLFTPQASLHAQTSSTTAASTQLQSADKRDESTLVNRAFAALEQLRADVIVYRSYGEFENDGRLARVPLDTFIDNLNQVTAEVEAILPQLSDAKLRNYISNSLYSYRDGAFWWAKLDQRRVVTTAGLRLSFATSTPAERFLNSTVPHTVVIHWRHANEYLMRAHKLVTEAKATGVFNSRSNRI